MAPENLVGKAYTFTADEDSRARDQADTPLPLSLPAERALRTVPFDLVALRSASKDHPAMTVSFSFSAVLSLCATFSFSPGLVGLRMTSSISRYSLASS